MGFKYFGPMSLNTVSIANFYRSIINENIDFLELSSQRIEEIQSCVETKRFMFNNKACGLLNLSCVTADKLITSAKSFGLNSATEKVLFYILMVDPNLKYLQMHNQIADPEIEKKYFKQQYGYYDKTLIFLETGYYIQIVLGKNRQK